jgi:peptidoglycan/LPS O-acetylase OafA/YrhL
MGDQKIRVFGLDFLRCIAIILVLIAHTFSLKFQNPALETITFYSGLIGVEVFFVLSGFLIGSILIKNHNYSGITSFSSIKSFWIRRWFRTLPNYYLVIIIYELLYYSSQHHLIFSVSNNFTYLVFLQNFYTPMPENIFGVSWSLSIEEWFYLLFPLFLFGVQYLIKSKSKAFLAVALIFILLPLLLRIYFALSNMGLSWDQGYRKMVPLRLDAIGTGVLLSYLKYYHADFFYKYKGLFFSTGLALFIGVIGFFYSSGLLHIPYSGFLQKTIFFTFLSVSLAALIPWMYEIKVDKISKFIWGPVTFISLISYSLYLLHPIVIIVVFIFSKKFNWNLNGYAYITVVWVLTIVLSYLQYHFFESKMTALREKFSKGKRVTTL